METRERFDGDVTVCMAIGVFMYFFLQTPWESWVYAVMRKGVFETHVSYQKHRVLL